ncbi:MAG: pirin family protein [Atopobiaceae bacterium]
MPNDTPISSQVSTPGGTAAANGTAAASGTAAATAPIPRRATNVVKGYRTQDGAGVSLVRVLGNQTALDFDPFLMLDSFDSTNPADYTAGFPLHPHRGIETVSYVRSGAMHHRDTMGFEDTVTDKEVQWMCAGSGVEHEETIPATGRLLGVQLWLNLPADQKMAAPTYHAIKRSDIESIQLEGATLRLLAGNFVDPDGVEHHGHQGEHLPLDYYELTVEPGATVTLDVQPDRSVMAFTLEGSARIGSLPLGPKTAAKLEEGSQVVITATDDGPSVVLVMSSVALHEPVAWGGPIVMNTIDQLHDAFRELDEGTFLRQGITVE